MHNSLLTEVSQQEQLCKILKKPSSRWWGPYNCVILYCTIRSLRSWVWLFKGITGWLCPLNKETAFFTFVHSVNPFPHHTSFQVWYYETVVNNMHKIWVSTEICGKVKKSLNKKRVYVIILSEQNKKNGSVQINVGTKILYSIWALFFLAVLFKLKYSDLFS